MISVISDVHIKQVGDEPYNLLLSFLNHPTVNTSEYVVFLGDIFDLFVGGDEKFFNEFKEIFDGIKRLVLNGVNVKYIEGNHDFHLDKFFKTFFPYKNFEYSKSSIILNYKDQNLLLCHGDDIELENFNYKIYSSLIRSYPVKFLAEYIVPFSVTRKIGNWASEKSRKKNVSKYNQDSELIKNKFRRSASEASKFIKNCKYIVSGHSHIKDLAKIDEDIIYINNGYAPVEKTFIFIDEEVVFIDLAETSP